MPFGDCCVKIAFVSCFSVPALAFGQNSFPTVGNVGIGCSNPNATLSVMGSSKLMGELEVDSNVTFQSAVIVEDKIVLGAVRDSSLTELRLAGIDPDGKLGVMGDAPGRSTDRPSLRSTTTTRSIN